MSSGRRGSVAAKLTEDAVRDIKMRVGRNPPGDRHHFSGWSYGELAKRHGVSKALVAQIATGRAWSDVYVERDDEAEAA